MIIDSALGLLGAGPKSNEEFLAEVNWLQDYLSAKPPPKFPFADRCRHEPRRARWYSIANAPAAMPANSPGRAWQLRGVDTDPERLWTWKKEHAIAANNKVKEFDIERKGLVEEDLIGYNPPFLDGLWLRAPYLHNGAVPTLRDMLKPPAERPAVFWRGYDVYDPVNVGFVSSGDARRGKSARGTTLRSVQRQWRPPVRHDAAGGGQGCAGRISEDAVALEQS